MQWDAIKLQTWRTARRLLPTPAKEAIKRTLPQKWLPQGSFARACLEAMEVEDGASLTPLQQVYVDFALSTNERGSWAAQIISEFKPIAGTRCLDIGCAYGGFLVGLGHKGARELVGVDLDPRLLRLGRFNLEEQQLPATLGLLDIHDDPAVDALGRFDIVVCNDVLEHVSQLPHAIRNMCRLCAPDGLIYAVVPNKYFPRYLLKDSHYQLQGITLLAHDDAATYFEASKVGSQQYDVGHYRTLTYYEHHLRRCGMEVQVYKSGLGIYHLGQLREEFERVREEFAHFSFPALPASLTRKITTRFAAVHRTFVAMADEHDNLLARRDEAAAGAVWEDILRRFGMEGWFIIARKVSDGPVAAPPRPRRPRPTRSPREALVDDAMKDYLDEHPGDAGARTSRDLDRIRFIKSLEWIEKLDLRGLRVLELGGFGLASHVVRRAHPDNEYVQADFDLRQPFPQADDSFDVALAMEVIEHVCDVEYHHATTLSGVRQCLAEIRRVLRPGGRLFLTTPNAASVWVIQRVLLQQPPWAWEWHFREFTPTEMRTLVEEAGLTVVEAGTEKVWNFWNFDPILEFMADKGYSLEERGDDIFLLAAKPA